MSKPWGFCMLPCLCWQLVVLHAVCWCYPCIMVPGGCPAPLMARQLREVSRQPLMNSICYCKAPEYAVNPDRSFRAPFGTGNGRQRPLTWSKPQITLRVIAGYERVRVHCMLDVFCRGQGPQYCQAHNTRVLCLFCCDSRMMRSVSRSLVLLVLVGEYASYHTLQSHRIARSCSGGHLTACRYPAADFML